MSSIILLIGSNIDPVKHIRKTIRLLRKMFDVQDLSIPWETPAVGSEGPNFINIAVRIQAETGADQLKADCLRRIELHLGRVRSSNKNAPRTIDLDVIVVDNVILDPGLWNHAHIALPVAELAPELIEPQSHLLLSEIAIILKSNSQARPRMDIFTP